MHGREESSCPFPSIFHPNAKEFPLFFLSGNLRAKSKRHDSFGELLANLVNLLVGLPDVLAKYGLTVSSGWEAFTRTEEWGSWSLSNISLEKLQESVTVSAGFGLSCKVIVVARVNTITDKLSGVAR